MRNNPIFQKGGSDPYAYVGIVDRPIGGYFDPEPTCLWNRMNYIYSLVVEAGLVAVEARIRSNAVILCFNLG